MRRSEKRPWCKRVALSLTAAGLLVALIAQSAAGAARKDKTFVMPDITSAEIASTRYTRAERGLAVPNRLTTEGFEKKLENGQLEVWFRAATAGVRVVDKRSGYVWGTLAADTDDDLNEVWNTMAQSLLTLEYFDESRNEKNLSLTDDDVLAEYDWQSDRLRCRVESFSTGLSFAFTMALEQDSLVFAVEDGSLSETGDCKVKSVYFAPFLGCARGDSLDGYLLIPDGPGALIRFAPETQYVKPYEAKVYGLDTGTDTYVQSGDLRTTRTNDYMTDAQQATVPLYGIVHGAGKNALLGVAEQGAEYAAVLAYPAGVLTPYNWATVRFDYRTLYTEPTSQDGSGIERVQETANAVSPRLRLTFFHGDEADYSGMAVAYRQRLEAQGALGSERVDAQIPLQLNVVGADVKQGLIFKGLSVLTTANQARQIVDDLRADGVHNLTLTYDGWRKGGLHGSAYNTVAFERRLGGKSAFLSLQKAVTQQGGRFYLRLDPVTATEDQISLLQAPAVSMSGQQQKRTRLNNQILYNETYFIKPSLTAAVVQRCFAKLPEFSFAFDKLGSCLYADYTRNRTVDRTQALQNVTALFGDDNPRAALAMPNAYLWGQAAEIYDFPLSNSQYTYETDTVPFLPILLKGHVDFYAPYANQGFYSVYGVLKMIEYGAYPSFIVSYASNLALNRTPVEDYFSIHFGDWRATIGQVYKQVDEALSAVEGAHITRHTAPQTGVAQITYDNGVQITVNYTNAAYTDGETTVAAQSASVRRVGA